MKKCVQSFILICYCIYLQLSKSLYPSLSSSKHGTWSGTICHQQDC